MSIKLRLIISILLILLFFIIGTGYTLDKSFYKANKSAMQEQLTTQLYLLMAATEITHDNKINMAASLLESKFSLPASGLYAYIMDSKNNVLWSSLSTIGISTPKPISLEKGKQENNQSTLGKTEFYNLSYGVNWLAGNNNIHITFNVQSDLTNFYQQIFEYRTTMWSWLAGMAILLLVTLTALLYWGFSPLSDVIREVNAIESGEQDKIKGQYPPEIKVLSKSINLLIEHAQTRQNRYKNALGDLAHSLKTPLAVIRSTIEKLDKNTLTSQLDEHITKIDDTIQYQLQRASSAGKSLNTNSVALENIINRIISTLNKVYLDKNIQFQHNLTSKDISIISEDDSLELFGNLLENAYKWCSGKVSLQLTIKNNKSILCISDDGPGIEEHSRKKILERGFRADSSTPGHGIGLAIVQDILAMYHSELEISESELGGAKICFSI